MRFQKSASNAALSCDRSNENTLLRGGHSRTVESVLPPAQPGLPTGNSSPVASQAPRNDCVMQAGIQESNHRSTDPFEILFPGMLEFSSQDGGHLMRAA